MNWNCSCWKSVMALLVALNPFSVQADSITMDFRRSSTEKASAELPADARYVCKRSAAAPVIDGKLDDEVWRSLRPIAIGTDAPGTIARACYDAENLYFAFQCEELPGRTTRGTPKERDGRVWEDDAIEIGLRPPQAEKLGVWYHFIISAANSVYDQRMRFGAAYGAAYNPEFSHAVHREEGRWSVEVALPSSAIEGTGWPGRLGVSLGRDGPGIGARFWKTRRDVARSALILEGIEDNSTDGQATDGFVGNQPVEGDSLGIYVDRSYARPGERWIEIDCRMKPRTTTLEKTRLDVKLFAVAGTTPVAEFSTTPTRSRGKLAVDLRQHDLAAGELSVELFEEGRRTAATRFRLEAKPCDTPFQPNDTAALTIDVPDGVSPSDAYPVTFGLPFPAGALWSEDEVRLTDRSGRAIPHEKEVTALWAPDGSIKWMRFDALVTPEDGCRLERADGNGSVAPATPLRVTQAGDEVTIDTGAARYVFGKGSSPIREIWRNGRLVATSANSRGLYVVDQKGRLARAVAEEEEMRVEASGPVASCVRFEGWYATEDGTRLARHITRIECFAGEEAAKISHTLVLTEDSNEVWFREVGLELAATPGAASHAIFGIDAEAHGRQLSIPLTTTQPSAHMLQDSHFHFNHGANHFQLAAGKEGAFETRHEGDECGDYAALVGDRGGLTVVCRNAARQHPKEFEVHGDRLTLKLFSNRAGEELDFRTETLIEKWDLANWYEHRTSNNHYANSLRKHVLDALKGYRSNAAGWAKTHELLVAPLGENGAARAAQHARLLRTPVYVHVDPKWIYGSRAMGPNYPKDPARFPEIEKTVDAYVDWLIAASERWGEYGFVDFNGGPRFNYHERDGELWAEMRRFNLTYALRANLWLLYARSGDRATREFISGSAQGHRDGKMSNWDTPVSRLGCIRSSRHRDLPFDWGEGNFLQNGQTGCLNTHLWDYYLTGDRRARDMIEAYAAAAKKRWSPAGLMHPTYPAFTLLRLVQAYAYNWDPELRDLCSASMDILEDKEAELRVNKYAYTKSDPRTKASDIVRVYIEGWNLLGETRYYNVARALGELNMNQFLLRGVDDYVPTMGRVAAFLYNDRPEPILAENMQAQTQRVPALLDPNTGELNVTRLRCAAQGNFLGRIGSALHVVAESDADRSPATSWLAFDNAGSPTSVIVQKPGDGAVNLRYTAPGPPQGEPPVTAVKPKGVHGTRLYRVTSRPSARPADTFRGTVTLPKDMAGYAYRVSFSGTGPRAVFADRRVPLVLHAPGYWYPEPVQRPGQHWYFRLQPESRNAQIFFEGSGKLYGPSGAPFQGGKEFTGWVDLPPEKPGLWAFELTDYKMVRVRNLPPFFAVRDPANHFVPPIEWQQEPPAQSPEHIPAATVYLPGAIDTKGNQSLHLARGRRSFKIEAGPAREDGDGTAHLPYREGTIEFFMNPVSWESFSLPDRARQSLFSATLEGGGHFRADYTILGREKTLNAFLDTTYTNSPSKHGKTLIRSHRPNSLLERGRWHHLAYVWGPREDARYHPARTEFGEHVLTVRIYLNGKYLGSRSNRQSGQRSRMTAPMRFLSFSASGIALDELRVSDIQRYTENFKPPSRDQELPKDPHTRVLYHFNGNKEAE